MFDIHAIKGKKKSSFAQTFSIDIYLLYSQLVSVRKRPGRGIDMVN